MKTLTRYASVLLLLVLLAAVLAVPAFAAGEEAAPAEAVEAGNTVGMKAIAAGVAIGIAAAAGAVAMGMATSRTVESIARQPEAEGKIRTSLMLGLVFIETAIIYALLAGILIIFVL